MSPPGRGFRGPRRLGRVQAMGLVDQRIAEIRRAGRDARWKVETLARVGKKLGLV